jgi:sugar phosphate isomerase/epimerase
MMRLCCLSLSFRPQFSAKQLDDLTFVDLCAQLQFDGVDFNIGSFRSLARDHLKRVKKSCLERGLTIACVGINNNFGRPVEEQAALQQQIREGIDTAQFLGAPIVRLFGGSVRPGDNREAVWKRSVEGLRRAAEYGEKAGVVAALQNHNHGNIASTGADILNLLKLVFDSKVLHVLAL